ncbi:MAG: homoserine O-acetyltransferase family protein [Bacillota bacterium]
MFTTKHVFSTPRLDLEIGTSIAATVGYETYGHLSPARDNAVLLCHPFAGSSHAAGRYHDHGESAGWWEPLIGPGKAFDTNRFFVVAVDSLCNLNLRDATVVTTGPGTLAPETGQVYGNAFPQVTVRDNVRLQRQLLDSLGITELACVAGPSTGGFAALEWAVTYPRMVRQVIAVASGHVATPLFALGVCQAAIDAIGADPDEGVVRATQQFLTLSRSNDWLEAVWGRRTAVASAHPWADREGRYAFQAELEDEARRLACRFDPDHFRYSARMAILHDIAHGNRDLEVAAQKIKAEVLLMPISSDILFPPAVSEGLAELIRAHGGKAEVVEISSSAGHQASLLEAHRLTEPIMTFLGRPALH